MKRKLKGVADFFRSEEPKGKQKETVMEESRIEPQVSDREPVVRDEKKEEERKEEERKENEREGEIEKDCAEANAPAAEIEVPVRKGTAGEGATGKEKEDDPEEPKISLEEKISKALVNYCIARRLPPDVYDSMKEAFGKIIEDCSKGELTEQAVSLLHHAVSYEESVEEARKEGRIAGRNEAIEEKLRSEEHPDDIPSLGGTSTGTDNLPRTSIFDLARGAV